MGNYDDIINLPHHVSTKHPQMPAIDRAAQFSPFAALTGHEAAIAETARLTEAQQDLDENRKEELDRALREILAQAPPGPEVMITCFVPDLKKQGGAYVSVSGRIKRLDEPGRNLIMENGTVIPMDGVYGIERL